MIIFAIAAVLLAVSFVAIYLFTMISNQMSVQERTHGELEALALYMKGDIAEEDWDTSEFWCMLFVIEGTPVPDEDGDYENYTVEYNITRTFNSAAIRADERTAMRGALLEHVEKGDAVRIESPAHRVYILNSVTSTAEYKFPKVSDAPPEEPVVPDDPIDLITIIVQNKTFAVYDNTAEQNTLGALTVILISVFIVVISVMFVLGYLLSGRVLKPASDAFTSQKDLIANASHELKTPITIINANLDVLSANGEATVSENKKWLENIESQTRRMNELVIEMLELSSFESAQYVPDVQTVNISEEVEGTTLSFEAACFERNISLNTKITPKIIGSVDKKGISKLVLILLDNAVKYCDDKGRVKVILKQVKKSALLTVSNTGKRIPPEKMSRLFERFYKLGSESSSFGLGLSMAKTIVENMNGKITCSSDDEYTRFSVILPL